MQTRRSLGICLGRIYGDGCSSGAAYRFTEKAAGKSERKNSGTLDPKAVGTDQVREELPMRRL